MNNNDRFLGLVSEEKANTFEKNETLIRNRQMLKESRLIALKVLKRLDEINSTQKELAEKLEVSPQQISKIVKGRENLTLETIVKLQNVLKIPILASCYESQMTDINDKITILKSRMFDLENHIFSNINYQKTIEFQRKNINYEKTA